MATALQPPLLRWIGEELCFSLFPEQRERVRERELLQRYFVSSHEEHNIHTKRVTNTPNNTQEKLQFFHENNLYLLAS